MGVGIAVGVGGRSSSSGRWQSQQIGIAISLEDDGVTVYTHDGLRILREGEVESQRTLAREENARLQAEIARLRRLLSERNGQS